MIDVDDANSIKNTTLSLSLDTDIALTDLPELDVSQLTLTSSSAPLSSMTAMPVLPVAFDLQASLQFETEVYSQQVVSEFN